MSDEYKNTARGTRIFSKEDKLIDSTWQAVVQFIQWYNSKKVTPTTIHINKDSANQAINEKPK